MIPTVLYLAMIEGNPSQERKMAGIKRYCSSRGWEAEPVYRDAVSAANLKEILEARRPIGCVVEGVGNACDLKPALFGGIPIVYIGYPPDTQRSIPNFRFDAELIAKTAFAELSSGNPSCYAVVEHPIPQPWSDNPTKSFLALVGAAGKECFVFRSQPLAQNNNRAKHEAGLVRWIADLPDNCALFAVSDETAVIVARAARAAGRRIPQSLTILSVDNFTALCENAVPPISSIQLDLEREGFIAAQALGERINATNPALRGRVAAKDRRLKSQDVLGPLLVVRRKSTAGGGRSEKFVLEAIDAIRREACDGLAPAALIARFNVSKSLFNLRFREAAGHSVLDEITHVRLEKAMNLLAQTDTAIGAVPALCGYSCNRTLDAVFRARFGMGMRAWRALHSRFA
ncbi:MAG: substrate-binding domain-containing protein [Kiritimatiellae bacterium]|nr:substrate-binding domain-containing protein [Kiritimatiellia bacterium]